MKRLTCVLTIGLALALSNPAVASVRCGTDLIQKGDSVLLLLEACGEPDIGNSGILTGYGSGEVTYNFGPREFMVRVMISDGKIERTENLGYGFVQSEDGPLEE